MGVAISEGICPKPLELNVITPTHGLFLNNVTVFHRANWGFDHNTHTPLFNKKNNQYLDLRIYVTHFDILVSKT